MAAILITGGRGFLGREVARRYVEGGDKVTVFDNFSRQHLVGALPAKMDILHGDVRDSRRLLTVMGNAKPAVVVHMAAINGTQFFYEKPDEVLEVGIAGTLNVIRAVKLQTSVKQFIFMSSSEVYNMAPPPTPETVPLVVPDPANPRFTYATSKIAGEVMCHHMLPGRIVTILRPHNIYGPNMGMEHVIPQLVNKILAAQERGEPVDLIGGGLQRRCFCHIEDFGRAFFFVAGQAQSGTWNIGTNEETLIRRLAVDISLQLGVPQPLEMVDAPARDGDPMWRKPDISKITRLGFIPKWYMHTGLPAVVNWYAARYRERQHPQQENAR